MKDSYLQVVSPKSQRAEAATEGTNQMLYSQCLVSLTVISLSLAQPLKNGPELSMSSINVIAFNSAHTQRPHCETVIQNDNSFAQNQCNLNGMYELFILHDSFCTHVAPSKYFLHNWWMVDGLLCELKNEQTNKILFCLGTTVARPSICIISSISSTKFFISSLGHPFLYYLATGKKKKSLNVQHFINRIKFSREEK